MMFNFNKVFKDDSWKKENVIDKCPCLKCEEMKYFNRVQSFEAPEKCSHCKDYIIWIPEAIKKLAYLEKEAKPVVHALWIEGAENFTCGMHNAECSNCGCNISWQGIDGDYNYCPNCGARMDGKEG